MSIREALVPDELPLVRALFEEYAAGLDVDLRCQGFAEELAGLPGRYAAPFGGLWIAVDHGHAVGCVALRPLDRGVCEIKRLYLRPEARGTGVGRRLVETVLTHATAQGHRRVCLDTLPSMTGAIALYRTLGFAKIAPYYDSSIAGMLFFERKLR